MKKTLFFIFLIISVMTLNAEVFKSNQLGQKLEKADKVEEKGVYLVEEGYMRFLYVDGSVFWTESTIKNSPEETVVFRTYENSDEKLSRTYKDGRLIEESVTKSGITKTSSYGYSSGQLIFVSSIDLDGTSSVQSFLRSSDKKDVIGVSDSGSVRFLSDKYAYQNGEVLVNLAPGLVTSGEHRILENGDILILEDESTESVYNQRGQLLSRKRGEKLVTYLYDDDYLIRVETKDRTSRIVENYGDGKPYDRYEYENEVLVSHTVFKDEGNIKTMYSQGRVVAVVYYKRDNRTIDRIEYN